MVIKERKYCPKCGGQMYLDRDEFGNYFNCYKCGNIIDYKPEPKPQPQPIKYQRQI